MFSQDPCEVLIILTFSSRISSTTHPFECYPRILPQSDIKIIGLQFLKSTFLKFGISFALAQPPSFSNKCSHSPSSLQGQQQRCRDIIKNSLFPEVQFTQSREMLSYNFFTHWELSSVIIFVLLYTLLLVWKPFSLTLSLGIKIKIDEVCFLFAICQYAIICSEKCPPIYSYSCFSN